MDPVHLKTEEIDYELRIRGVYNLSTMRLKTQTLREFLRREGLGENTVTGHAEFDPSAELARCNLILSDIDVMANSALGASALAECRSRLVHVGDRAQRAKPSSPEDQAMVYDLVAGVKERLDQLARSDAGGAPTKPAPRTTASQSVLADIIETIAVNKEVAGRATPARESFASDGVGYRSVLGNRPSSLNPSLPPFVPAAQLEENPFRHGPRSSVPTYHPPQQQFHQQIQPARAFGDISSNVADFLRTAHAGVAPPRGDDELRHFRPAPSARSAVSVSSERDHDEREFRRPAFRPMRKTVPVHQWKLVYSGESNGMHLYDFLSEIDMFKRSEDVTDDDLLSSVVHLLAGRARLWYRSWFDTFHTWGDLVVAMKREFLPPKYDYRLLTNISNRRQKPNETFAEYLSTMQSLFKYLSIPIAEPHKLCIVEENMLQKYAIALSTVDITSLDQLANVCRRIDFAYAKPQFSVPFDGRAGESRQPPRNAGGRPRELNELDMLAQPASVVDAFADLALVDERESSAQQCATAPQHDGELLEVRRGGTRGAPQAGDLERKCFNCQRAGHNFSVCPSPKSGIFCYRCGSREVTAFSCPKCAKNGSDSAHREGGPNPCPQ